MQKTILITGPESAGKSELTGQLAQHFGGVAVMEYARTYLGRLRRPYGPADLPRIWRGQRAWEDAARRSGAPYVFCDTGPEVLYIWSLHKYGRVAPSIAKALDSRSYDLRLIGYPDLPWAPDPLREAPDAGARLALFDAYCQLHTQRALPYTVVGGLGDARLAYAIAAVEQGI
jgi:nicotinamide riboside kinase